MSKRRIPWLPNGPTPDDERIRRVTNLERAPITVSNRRVNLRIENRRKSIPAFIPSITSLDLGSIERSLFVGVWQYQGSPSSILFTKSNSINDNEPWTEIAGPTIQSSTGIYSGIEFLWCDRLLDQLHAFINVDEVEDKEEHWILYNATNSTGLDWKKVETFPSHYKLAAVIQDRIAEFIAFTTAISGKDEIYYYHNGAWELSSIAPDDSVLSPPQPYGFSNYMVGKRSYPDNKIAITFDLWQSITFKSLGPNALSNLGIGKDGRMYVMAASTPFVKIFTSDNFGNSWVEVYSDEFTIAHGSVFSAHFENEQKIAFLYSTSGQIKIAVSNNRGNTWNIHTFGSDYDHNYVMPLIYAFNNIIYVTLTDQLLNNLLMSFSLDDGITWSIPSIITGNVSTEKLLLGVLAI